jgi:regulatory protein
MEKKMDAQSRKAADRMRNLCSRREYCSKDVLNKLLKALDGDREEAERILALLVKEGYVDDLRYSSAFARDKSSIAGWGDVKIRYMLSAKGISREIISKALEDIDDSKASDRMRKLVENKARSLKDDPQARMKLLRFGLGRGYSYEELASVIEDTLRK